mmetsp:Transcript_19796/g.60067  ORF Transcript_19796/g.60067 Transcript_19796/m.60067 type:complete len:411 (+) Transcript_19796:551-1783(+)
MFHAKLVEHISRVHPRIGGHLTRNDFEGLSKGTYQELLLAVDLARLFPQICRKFHLDGTAAGNDGWILEQTARVHDGIVQRAFGLLNELLGTTAEDERARRGALATLKKIEALAANLPLFKSAARSQNAWSIEIIARGLNLGLRCLRHLAKVAIFDTAGAEKASIRKILGGQVSDGKFGQHDVSTRGHNLGKLIVNDVPFSIDHLLICSHISHTHFGVVPLSLELQLYVKQHDLRVLEVLGHLLKPCIRKCLLESNSLDEHRILERASNHLLRSQHLKPLLGIKGKHSIHDHLGEEMLMARHQLRVERCSCSLLQHGPRLLRRVMVKFHRQVVKLFSRQTHGFSESLDDNLWVDALLDKRLGFTQEFSSQEYNRSGTITNLRILRHRDLHESVSCRMDNLQLLHKRSTII